MVSVWPATITRMSKFKSVSRKRQHLSDVYWRCIRMDLTFTSQDHHLADSKEHNFFNYYHIISIINILNTVILIAKRDEFFFF